MPGEITITPATPDDIPLVMHLIRALAEYEHELESAQATPEQLHEALFGPNPSAEAVLGRPGLWLEDLFVYPEQRRFGVGKALLQHLARICVNRNYTRFEWSVLDWN